MQNIFENLTIGTFAKAAGVNVETIRFYQRKDLLPEPDKPHGSIRRYGEVGRRFAACLGHSKARHAAPAPMRHARAPTRSDARHAPVALR